MVSSERRWGVANKELIIKLVKGIISFIGLRGYFFVSRLSVLTRKRFYRCLTVWFESKGRRNKTHNVFFSEPRKDLCTSPLMIPSFFLFVEAIYGRNNRRNNYRTTRR